MFGGTWGGLPSSRTEAPAGSVWTERAAISWICFELQMDLRAHPFANLDILLDRLIVFQSGRKLMGSKRNVSESVWGRLRRLSVQQDGGAGRFGLHGKSGDFLNLFEQQMDLRAHSSANLNVLS